MVKFCGKALRIELWIKPHAMPRCDPSPDAGLLPSQILRFISPPNQRSVVYWTNYTKDIDLRAEGPCIHVPYPKAKRDKHDDN